MTEYKRFLKFVSLCVHMCTIQRKPIYNIIYLNFAEIQIVVIPSKMLLLRFRVQ